MQDPPNDTSSYADDIFGVSVYEAPSPPAKIFLPWHRPRKQFVRDRQWCEQIRRLLDEFPRDSNTLKYFGLPGDDLLDLRQIHSSICEPRQIQLRFLGFNNSANPASNEQVELNISLDEIRKLSLIDPGSDVIPDDFCRVANDNSIAWARTQKFGPYDVINIDLCDGFGKHAPGTFEDTYYSALSRLISLQARYSYPWLLLLTTRVGQDDIHQEVLEKLLTNYLRNLTDCAGFKIESDTKFAIADEDALRKAVGTSVGLLQVFLVGICKWFVGKAVSLQPPSKVEIKSVIGYRVEVRAEQEDLVSLAIRFEPTFDLTNDPVGLVPQPQTAHPPSECELAIKALRRISNRINADEILRNNSALNSEMIEAMLSLLQVARYDIDAYREWLSQSPD